MEEFLIISVVIEGYNWDAIIKLETKGIHSIIYDDHILECPVLNDS